MRTILCFLLLFFLIPSFLVARNVADIVGESFEEIAGRGLEIHTNPAGVRVFIDGVERGLTPVAFENLASGDHHIRLTREGFKDHSFNISLVNNSRLVISIKMEEIRGVAIVSIHQTFSLQAESSNVLPFNPQVFTSGHNQPGFPRPHSGSSSGAEYSDDNNIVLNLPVGYNTIRARAFGWEDTEITVMINEHNITSVDIFMSPAAFRISNVTQSRRRFNPLNPGGLGITEYRFEVSAPGTGTITIRNTKEENVFSGNLGIFETWHQQFTWNGRDQSGSPLPFGTYTVLLEVTSITDLSETQLTVLETEISYSANIIPLSLESGISGLTFAPMPHVLPVGSFQFEAGIFVGNFLLPQTGMSNSNENTTFGFPFKINMRVSPVNRLELATSFNINPYLEKQTGWGLLGSAKFNIIEEKNPLSFATGISYAWAGEDGEPPLSPGRGVSLYAITSLDLSQFSIVFCPGLFWQGPEGLTPALLLTTGVHYRSSWITTGISARYEHDFLNKTQDPILLAGAEVHLFPPPSNLVFSITGGIMTRRENTGIFGGLRIGVIN